MILQYIMRYGTIIVKRLTFLHRKRIAVDLKKRIFRIFRCYKFNSLEKRNYIIIIDNNALSAYK